MCIRDRPGAFEIALRWRGLCHPGDPLRGLVSVRALQLREVFAGADGAPASVDHAKRWGEMRWQPLGVEVASRDLHAGAAPNLVGEQFGQRALAALKLRADGCEQRARPIGGRYDVLTNRFWQRANERGHELFAQPRHELFELGSRDPGE